MTTFIDTNILLALLNEQEDLHEWSINELQKCKLQGPALVSDIVYCEFSVGMPSQDAVDAAVAQFALERVPHNDQALYRAGLAFKKYRTDNKGPKPGVLPDFLIGAIADVAGAPLLTANPKDFVGYFPDVKLIAP